MDERALSCWNTDGGYHTNPDGTYDKWTVIQGTRTFYIGNSSDDGSAVVTELEIAPAPGGMGFGVDAPEAAASGEPFTVTITTDASVDTIPLLDASGEPVRAEGRTAEYTATENIYTLTLRQDSTQTYTVRAQDMLGNESEIGIFTVSIN